MFENPDTDNNLWFYILDTFLSFTFTTFGRRPYPERRTIN